MNWGVATVWGANAIRPYWPITRRRPLISGSTRSGHGPWTSVMAFLGKRRRRWAEDDDDQPDPLGRLKPIDFGRIVELSGPDAEHPDADDDQAKQRPEQMTAASPRWLPRRA